VNAALIRQLIRDTLNGNVPTLVVLIGSNGAGKSTFHELNLAPSGLPFVNADNIARSLAGNFAAITDEHSKVAMFHADALRRQYVAEKQSFIMETVLSDPHGAKLEFMREAIAAGFFLLVIHIRLDNPSTSIARVSERVEQGGHDVPDEKLHARFPRTARNAAVAVALADLALVFDNSVVGKSFQWLETWKNGTCVDRATR